MYISYQQKYLKYKIKYQELINQNSGNPRKLKPEYKKPEERDFIEGTQYEDSVKYKILQAIKLENESDIQGAKWYYIQALNQDEEEAIEDILNFKENYTKNTEALFWIGKELINNIYSNIDINLYGEEILKLAISKNNFKAALYLGKLYEKGYKVEKNISKALDLYELVKSSKDYELNSIAKKRIYNINNNIIYTCKERIIKIYILALLQGYNKIKIINNYFNDSYGDSGESHYSKEKFIKPHKASSIFINNYILYTNDYDVMLVVVKQDGLALEYATDNIKKEFFIVLNAVNQNGLAIQYASFDLKKNQDIIKKAIKQNGMALQYVLKDLVIDKTILEKFIIDNHDNFVIAVEQNGLVLQYASDAIKNNKEIVKKAVEQNGLALQYASDDKKNNKEIVLKAVEQNGLALQYAYVDLKNNKEIVLKAVEQNGLALQYAYVDLKKDLNIVAIAIKKNSSAINFTEFKNDLLNLSWLLYNYNTEIIKFADYNIQNNYDVILYCVKKDGLLLEFASDDLKKNEDIVLAAIKQNFLALKFASIELKENPKIIFTFLFKQRNFLFLFQYLISGYNADDRSGGDILYWTDKDKRFHEEYPDFIPMILPIKFIESGLYNNSYNSILYENLLGIRFNNEIPSDMCVQNNHSYINHLLNNRNVPTIDAAENFIKALQDKEFITEYISIILKCCKKVSINLVNKLEKEKSIISVKNHQFKYNLLNKYYKFIGLPKFIKDKILCYSGLLKHLIKKIYKGLQSDESIKINKLIINRCINIKTLQTAKGKYFLDKYTDNSFLVHQIHSETI